MRKIIYSGLIMFPLFGFINLKAQTLDYPSTKEKVYLQTNHSFFKPGQTVYFKAYIVKAADQTPTEMSSLLNVEVLNPSGNVLQKLNCKIENGYATGSYDFKESSPGGIYKLRAYTTWMRNENDSTFFERELTVQKLIAPRILLKLDFPEKGYGAGDEVTAKFSVRNLSDQPIKFLTAKYTVSLEGKSIQVNEFKTNQNGIADVRFNLPQQLNSNDGLLNITVQYDAYTESISRSIPIVLNKIDLQFMPEGGSFIDGIPTYIAFKAVNENGKAADVKGEIRDNAGNTVARFSSYQFGMGKFAFTAQTGIYYTAIITSPGNIKKVYSLPLSKPHGVSMNCLKKNEKITVKLLSTDSREVVLSASTKNVQYYNKTIQLQKGTNEIEIDENLFPVGIAQFTLHTSNNLPLAERLVFLNEGKNLRVTIRTDKKKYLPREKVSLTIKTMSDEGKPVASNFAVSIVDDKLWTYADDRRDHILSWLLMSSELRGKVEEPQFYFKKDEPKASPSLDLVMLTNGYRYFDYIEYVQKEQKLKFTPDQGNILNGVTVDKNGNAIKSTIFLVQATTNGKAISIHTTDDGLFFFSELLPNTNYYLFAQAVNKQPVTIKVLQNGFGHNIMKSVSLRKLSSDSINEPLFTGRLATIETKVQEATSTDNKNAFGQRVANLEEVVVVGYGAMRKKELTGSATTVQAKEIIAQNGFGFAMQGRVAGLQVSNNANFGASPKVFLRGARTINGNQQPLLIVNGFPTEDVDLNTVNLGDIESVTVLKDASATAIYGARAANGVIVINSKKYNNDKIRINFNPRSNYASQLVHTTGPVYSVAKEFYAPEYTSLIVEERNDLRETIYWNPVVQTDKNGIAKVEFYNSDASTTFRVIAEGIGYNGKLGRTEFTYAAQNALSVDAKIPPYLTVGDKALLPLVIKNNRTEPLDLTVSVYLPSNMRAGKFNNSLRLAPDSAKQLLIPVEATEATKGFIKFLVNSSVTKETLTLPVEASEKGFPVIETFSGNKSAEYKFIINQLIPGSLQTQLKLYRNLEGHLLDGIESMLREPYGCFEQTSSTTYPNIYVLKYLRESGKSNPEIEKKALAYLQRGYERLVGFETAQDGFEWFGKTPPHEALTAYGLLEFTDMKEFIKVDERMLDRTKKYLLSRRDGQGGFKLANGGYDQFASVPNRIANIYIVYALTQAGIGKEITAEYNAAVKKALSSNDGYMLAMTALSASNMKQEKDFRELTQALAKLYNDQGLSSETSVVCSKGISLQVETAALYALALMHEPLPKTELIAKLISHILSQKSYYGYGSTQATVLALKAVVEYSKLTGKISENAPIVFTANNQKVDEAQNFSGTLMEGSNSFAVAYSNQKKTIPYNFEVSYHTLTPPNNDKAELKLSTELNAVTTTLGETVRMQIQVKNTTSKLQPMAIAKLGIPAGLSVQPWQLKELMEKSLVAYYEIFDNYLVFYWMGFRNNETKVINLDLKAEVPGTYKAKASTAYLYYTPEYKNWNEGLEITVKPDNYN